MKRILLASILLCSTAFAQDIPTPPPPEEPTQKEVDIGIRCIPTKDAIELLRKQKFSIVAWGTGPAGDSVFMTNPEGAWISVIMPKSLAGNTMCLTGLGTVFKFQLPKGKTEDIKD